MRRYQRQIILPQVKIEGQKSISQARILIVGAGGLGTPAAQYLAAAGVGHLGIIDGDIVAESNLHRQVLFGSSDIGKRKALVLREKLTDLNGDCDIEAYPYYLDKKKALVIFPQYDIIVDGTDNFSTKYLINDVAVLFNKPVVFGAISQFEGQVSVFWKDQGPCYRCLYPQAPQAKIQNCAEAGVLGPLPGIIGSMQAMECLKLVLYRNTESLVRPLFGQLVSFDFGLNMFYSAKLTKRAACLCSQENLQAEDIVENQISECSLAEPKKPEQLIDVRSQEEWDEFHIEGSLHWPLARIEKGDFPELKQEQEYFCICMTGLRAQKSQEIMKKNGFEKIDSIKGSVYEYSTGR